MNTTINVKSVFYQWVHYRQQLVQFHYKFHESLQIATVLFHFVDVFLSCQLEIERYPQQDQLHHRTCKKMISEQDNRNLIICQDTYQQRNVECMHAMVLFSFLCHVNTLIWLQYLCKLYQFSGTYLTLLWVPLRFTGYKNDSAFRPVHFHTFSY